MTDPTAAAEPLAAPAGSRRLWSGRRRWLALLAVFGPGVVAASAGNDAGGIATYASAGAQFRYRMLFIMLLVSIGLVVVQEMSARLGAHTGEGLVSLIREHFSLRVGAFAVACLVAANVGLVVSEFAGIGAAFELFGVSRYVAVPIAAVVLWAVVVFGSYRYAERLFLALSLVFVTYLVAAVLAKPHWATAGAQAVLPHLLGTKAFLLLAVALIGTTITPYMQLYQAAAVADSGSGPDGYSRQRIDSVVGAVAASVVSMAIIVATAATIGGTGPLKNAAAAAKALQPVVGSAAKVLFGVGLLGAAALAAAVVPLATAYALSEAIGVERSVSRRFREAPFFNSLFTAQVVVGAAVALAPGNLVALLINTQVLNGVITPIFLVFILSLANRRSILGPAANGPIFRVVATVVVVVVAVLAATVTVQVVAGWFGIG
ncbi:MAG TPA: NRAMP family divalent metal transporter [Acidimicrobiales bacterium]